jgi:hypothetical protein
MLSDDRIVSMLTADGVNIARRTVAKYREAMRIPSSVERRRLKQGNFPARLRAVNSAIDRGGTRHMFRRLFQASRARNMERSRGEIR